MNLFRNVIAFCAGIIALVLAVPMFLLALPFWLVSLFTRVIGRLLQPQFLTRNQLIEFDRDFGWKSRPNLDTHHLMGDLFHIKTDADGFRGQAALDRSDIVVFGDSFAAGYGVGERHLFANLSVSPKIKPVGTGGYSMVQEYLWMQKLQGRLNSKLVVWFIYYGNDLYDNLMPDLRGYRKPFLRESETADGWEIVSSHVSADKWPIVTEGRMHGENHLPKLGELCGDTFIAKRAYPACEYLLRAGKQLCDEAGATLAVLGIPDVLQLSPEGQQSLRTMGGDPGEFDSGKPDRCLDAICSGLGIRFVAGMSFLDVSCYKTNDCHWNEKGHREIFRTLSALLKEPRQRSVIARTDFADALVRA